MLLASAIAVAFLVISALAITMWALQTTVPMADDVDHAIVCACGMHELCDMFTPYFDHDDGSGRWHTYAKCWFPQDEASEDG